ncbi:MAG: 2,3-bisphosphoglycerate-independent phosphoglycerate mutase [Nanoarchaeota archaeon]|nr:2,3-bisphosphoglycerate-independent phosphoglycerate mutase [Nanoarchaeota archaeon]
MTKIVLIIADGLGDRPIAELGYQTPLEAATTPHLDRMAKEGICGQMHTIDVGVRPGSDVAHLHIFGYPMGEAYSGRGVFEVLGVGMDLQRGDIAFRGNLATMEGGKLKDRRAGRMSSSLVIEPGMKVQIEDVTFLLSPAVSHRVGVIMRGPGLTHDILDVDPHNTGEAPRRKLAKDTRKESQKTERVINAFVDHMAAYLCNHPKIKQLKAEGKPHGNFLSLRGAGEHIHLLSFKEKYGLTACCISGAGLYKGVARAVGMDILNVEGATGTLDTNLDAKVKACVEQLPKYDFVFVHMKFADSLAEVGDFKGKKVFIERIDKSLAPLLKMEDTVVFFSGDHSTACSLKAHSGDPVPAVFWGPRTVVRTDACTSFGERACQQGGMGHFKGLDVMQELLNLAGKQHLVGN